MPVHWLDYVDRPWERQERERVQREKRENLERHDRMTRAGIPPPRCADERYGPLAQNFEGDEKFRQDRCVWFQHVTGESLEGLSLAEQWQRVDVLARGWRAYSDGRTGRTMH